jgi:hypothetical protein
MSYIVIVIIYSINYVLTKRTFFTIVFFSIFGLCTLTSRDLFPLFANVQCHIIKNLLTSTVRAVRENIQPRIDRGWFFEVRYFYLQVFVIPTVCAKGRTIRNPGNFFFSLLSLQDFFNAFNLCTIFFSRLFVCCCLLAQIFFSDVNGCANFFPGIFLRTNFFWNFPRPPPPHPSWDF